MVHFIGAGPGDPELLTIKGKRLIDSADVIIYAGSLVNEKVLADRKAGEMCIRDSFIDTSIVFLRFHTVTIIIQI